MSMKNDLAVAKALKTKIIEAEKKAEIVGKTKFVDMGDNEGVIIYRVTFSAYNQDYQCIRDEIIGYGTIIKEEKEVVDNG